MAKQIRFIKKIILGIIGAIVLFILIMIVNIIIVIKNEPIISKGQPIEKSSKNNSALLIVDIQEVITGNYSIYPSLQKNSEKLICIINQVVDSFKVHNYPVIYIRSEIANPFINLLNNSYAKGSPGVEYDKRLQIISNLEVVKTGKDSFRKTNLDDLLNKHKVNELYIVGLDAAECVNATVQAAQNRQYKVNIINEAVISKSERRTDSMMVCFRDRGVRVVQIDGLVLTK
jgi:nicotinamidase-related amidase